MRPPYRLDVSMEIPLPIDEVFAFFADARNLEAITPPSLKFSILTPMPVQMAVGLVIDYQLRLRGIPIRWQSEITAYDPPFSFVDEQRSGPYKLWRHEHLFGSLAGPDGAPATRVRDRVQYIPRGGPVIHSLLVRPELERIFAFRQTQIARLLLQAPSAR
ncbi:MAG: CDP-paratose 2-epimerase [Phycisphaerales bacterium]